MTKKEKSESLIKGILIACIGIFIIYFGYIFYTSYGNNNTSFLCIGFCMFSGGVSGALKYYSWRISTFFKGLALMVFGFWFPFAIGKWPYIFLMGFLGVIVFFELISTIFYTPPRSDVYVTKMNVNEYIELQQIKKVRTDFEKANKDYARMNIAYGASIIFIGIVLMHLFAEPFESSVFRYGTIIYISIIIIVGIMYLIFLRKHFKNQKFNFVLSLIGFLVLICSGIIIVYQYYLGLNDVSVNLTMAVWGGSSLYIHGPLQAVKVIDDIRENNKLS